jgi:hypothetical protein
MREYDKPNTTDLIKMELHKTYCINSNLSILRVIDGWLYYYVSSYGVATTFVPERCI